MRNERGGFSMIELLLVIAIMAVLSTVGYASFGGFSASNKLKKSLSEMGALVDATQKRSITQDGGKRWNVRFSNSTTTGSQFIVFSGTSFSASSTDRTYGIPNRDIFSEPSSGNVFDALFAPISGTLSSKKIISMVTGRGDGLVGDIIMNTAGLTTKRFENGLVGYWHFDEGTGTSTFDASGMGNTGTLTGSPTWQSGANCMAGNCLNFNGTSAYVDAGSAPSLNISKAFTVEAWVNPTTLNLTPRPWASKWPGMLTRITSTWQTQVYYYLQIGGATREGTANFSLNANAWNHLVETYDSSTHLLQFYLNGVLQNSISMPAPYVIDDNSANPLRVGNFNSEYFSGSMDEFRMYNHALSATEILNHYNDLK